MKNVDLTKKYDRALSFGAVIYDSKEMNIHTIEFPLVTSRKDEKIFEKRFKLAARIKNILIKEIKRRLYSLRNDDDYKRLLLEYADILNGKSKQNLKDVKDALNDIRIFYGVDKSSLYFYAKKQASLNKVNISSQQVQAIADDVWRAVEDVLFGDGKGIHFVKERNVNSVRCKSSNGIKVKTLFHNTLNRKDTVYFEQGQFEWLGVMCEIKIDYNDRYVYESLQHSLKYCDIHRRMFDSGYRYYVRLYLTGEPPRKIRSDELLDSERAEIDPGVSTMAVFSENGAILRELSPDAINYQKKIVKLQRRIDRAKRQLNPDNYNSDGTVKKGKHKWIISNNVLRLERKLKTLYRKEEEYRKQSHNKLANDIIRLSSNVRCEPMNYRALTKRSNKTERQEKISEIKRKDGTTLSIRKFKRKKRYGKSSRTRAPSKFLDILARKSKQYGGNYTEINLVKIKPSQYNHINDRFEKVPLSCREKMIGTDMVQRDLYSSFIGYCVQDDNMTLDKDKCSKMFSLFLDISNDELMDMKLNGISMPACFGF